MESVPPQVRLVQFRGAVPLGSRPKLTSIRRSRESMASRAAVVCTIVLILAAAP